MLILTVIKVALRSLLANKLRLFLTMLGIIIGVGAVIAMLALGEGAHQSALARIRSVGTNLLILRPSWRMRGGVRIQQPQRLYLEDCEAIGKMREYVSQVAPEVRSWVQAKHGNKNTRLQITGSTPNYFLVRNYEIERGRAFTEDEVKRRARVCVIGPQVAEDLFLSKNPIGQEITIKNVVFIVVGVTKAKGDQGWFNPDNQVFAPITTVMHRVSGQEYLDSINITGHSEEILPEAQAALTDLMRRRHHIAKGQEDDFRISNQAEWIERMNQMTGIFKALLAGVAGVSLLVGGIGIMNIMLVSVTERTREIGIRKALGARRRDILQQFIVESVVVSFIGGALGIGLGWAIAAGLSRLIKDFDTVITPGSILLAVSCACVVGLFFGIWPARKAARLDPIEALRYE